jgi:hypothetical protein
MGLPSRIFLSTFIWATTTLWFASPATPGTRVTSRPETRAAAQLRKLQPALSDAQALSLLRSVVLTAQDASCDFPWQILAAIAFHESSLGRHTTNASSGDHGLMQINDRMARRLGLDPAKVKADADYSLRAACRILRFNRDAYSARPYWLGIYRSGTRFSDPAIVANAERYSRMILRTAATLGYLPGPLLATAR